MKSRKRDEGNFSWEFCEMNTATQEDEDDSFFTMACLECANANLHLV
jgi:hypothetical protein